MQAGIALWHGVRGGPSGSGEPTRTGTGNMTEIRVMLIDSDQQQNTAIDALLAEQQSPILPYSLTVVGSMSDAYDTLRRSMIPHIILLAIELPGMSGLDALLELRDCVGEKVAIIVTGTTSVQDPILAQTCKRRGANALFTKPLCSEDVRRLWQFVRQRGAKASPYASPEYASPFGIAGTTRGCAASSTAEGWRDRRPVATTAAPVAATTAPPPPAAQAAAERNLIADELPPGCQQHPQVPSVTLGTNATTTTSTTTTCPPQVASGALRGGRNVPGCSGASGALRGRAGQQPPGSPRLSAASAPHGAPWEPPGEHRDGVCKQQ